MNNIKKQSFFLTTVFIFSLIARLIFFYIFLDNNPCQLTYDAGHYHELALSISNGQGITHRDGAAQFYRLPGYSFFLAACYKILGAGPQGALLVQIILSSLIPLLLFFLSLALFPENSFVALSAALVGAVHPGLLIFSGLVMTESLFLIFFLLFLIFFIKSLRDYSVRMIVGASFFLGIASLIRPVGHFVLAASCLLFLVLASQPVRQKVMSMLGLFLSWFVVVLPWLVRNYALTGYVFFHTLSGVHFLNHVAARLCMEAQDISYQQAQLIIQQDYAAALHAEQDLVGRPLFDIEESNVAECIAKNYMIKNPVRMVMHAVRNMLKTACGLYSSELLVIDSGGHLPAYSSNRTLREMVMRFLQPELNNKKIYAVIYFEMLLFFLLLVGFGSYLFYAARGWVPGRPLLIVLWYAGLFVGLSLACGYARLRLPVEPFLIIFGSYAWFHQVRYIFYGDF